MAAGQGSLVHLRSHRLRLGNNPRSDDRRSGYLRRRRKIIRHYDPDRGRRWIDPV